jgi:hypothetical protein
MADVENAYSAQKELEKKRAQKRDADDAYVAAQHIDDPINEEIESRAVLMRSDPAFRFGFADDPKNFNATVREIRKSLAASEESDSYAYVTPVEGGKPLRVPRSALVAAANQADHDEARNYKSAHESDEDKQTRLASEKREREETTKIYDLTGGNSRWRWSDDVQFKTTLAEMRRASADLGVMGMIGKAVPVRDESGKHEYWVKQEDLHAAIAAAEKDQTKLELARNDDGQGAAPRNAPADPDKKDDKWGKKENPTAVADASDNQKKFGAAAAKKDKEAAPAAAPKAPVDESFRTASAPRRVTVGNVSFTTGDDAGENAGTKVAAKNSALDDSLAILAAYNGTLDRVSTTIDRLRGGPPADGGGQGGGQGGNQRLASRTPSGISPNG